jgi:ubiquitin-conjugating enzyme E2 Q
VYTNDDVPSKIGQTLDNAMTASFGMRVAEMIKSLSLQLCNNLNSKQTDQSSDISLTDADADEDMDFSEMSEESDEDMPFDYGNDDDIGIIDGAQLTIKNRISDFELARIRGDFQAVRNAGFRVAKICGVDYTSTDSILAVSIRASKLGLSSETYAAWNMEPSEYVVLLMKYFGEYVPFERVIEGQCPRAPLELRLRKCSKYRPALLEAIEAFTKSWESRLKTDRQEQLEIEDSSKGGRLSTFGVGSSIDLLLNSDFFPMMKLRKSESQCILCFFFLGCLSGGFQGNYN